MLPALFLAAGLSIDHQAVDCMVKEKFPRIEADIQPAADVATARVCFKSADDPDYYCVPMTVQYNRFAARMPKPKEKAGPITYYVEAEAQGGGVKRTPELNAQVVKDAKSCPKDGHVAKVGLELEVKVFATTASTAKPKGFAGVSSVTPASSKAGSAPAAADKEEKKDRKGKDRRTQKATTPPVASPSPPALPEPVQAAAAAATPQEYSIGPDDILRVTVFGHEDLTQTLIVQPDGTFNYPLVGRVKASDMTPKELERKLGVLLSQGYIRNPQITINVQEYRSKTVFVVGEVMKPGTYPLAGSTTIVEILAKAGPTTANAGTEVVIVRPLAEVQGPVLPSEVEGGDAAKKKAEVLRVNIRDIQAGALDRNLVLRPNDTVFIPQAPKVFVSGQVRNPGGYPFAPGTTVRQVISLAGGLTDQASSRIRVVRTVDGKSKELKIRLDDPVEPGDTIVVKEKLF